MPTQHPAWRRRFMREKLAGTSVRPRPPDDLRRARDIEHFRLARQLGRTLVTLDRDYLDDRLFPPTKARA
jgi:predicted nuclease of predicted toxin-antitoxin system